MTRIAIITLSLLAAATSALARPDTVCLASCTDVLRTRPLNHRHDGGIRLPEQTARTHSLQLRAILLRTQGPVAIINDEKVRVGDRVGEARVLAIGDDAVRLLRDGDARVLTVYLDGIFETSPQAEASLLWWHAGVASP